MALTTYKIIKRIYKRCIIWRRINRLERIKLNAIRKKYRLTPVPSYGEWICAFICFPFLLTFQFIEDFFSQIISSLTPIRRSGKKVGQMRRVFMNNTEENKLFRKLLYFFFGLILTTLAFIFLYYQNFLTNYRLIFITSVMFIVLALIAPFKEVLLCLILISLPSLFSSKIRYVFVAYILFSLYIQIVPNIYNNGFDTIKSFGCTLFHAGKGGSQFGSFLVRDVKELVEKVREHMNRTLTQLREFSKAFDFAIGIPAINIANICKQSNDREVRECAEEWGAFEGAGHYPCTWLYNGFADFCDKTRHGIKTMYNKTKEEVLEAIEKIERELYFKADLNYAYDYHYNSSHNYMQVLKTIGIEFMDRRWLLSYLAYVLNVRILIVLVVSLWIIISSVLYLIRFLKSDAFDNYYISEELIEIDKKRSDFGKETIIPLNFYEKQTFISTFDITMTPIEWTRFLFGLILFGITLCQIAVYFFIDQSLYYLMHWHNQLIDVLIDVFAPASLKLGFEGDNFFAKKLRQMNNEMDVKQKIIERLNECKAKPLAPDKYIYQQISYLLILVFITLFSGSYGLRLRHYIAGLFYPKRIPIRAVWLYNNILSRRGNIFEFWRKQMRKKAFGEKGTESITFLERLCAQYPIVRIACKLLGLYGKHKYCAVCGKKAMIDGSDQSVQCANKCGAIYCVDCLGGQNNMCSVCMNPIDYAEIGDMSEEVDSSDEDIAYTLNNEDFLYQYEDKQTKHDNKTTDDFDANRHQRRDLVSLAYDYDSVDRVPSYVYLIDDDDNVYDGEDETSNGEDYDKYLFQLEQELGIPAEDILRMKENAKIMGSEDMDQNWVNRAKEDKYSQLKREDDQRLVRNAFIYVNRDRKQYLNKTKPNF